MLSTRLLSCFSGDQGVMAVLAQDRLLGTCPIAGIVFVGTGLVVMPLQPGDSPLFAAGAFPGLTATSPLAPMAIIAFAAIAGDAMNYGIGRSSLGQTIIRRGWVKPKHLAQTREWFDRYGGATITIGRFIPIVRTVAPFLAGLSGMRARQFALCNVIGGLLWYSLLMMAGVWRQDRMGARASELAVDRDRGLVAASCRMAHVGRLKKKDQGDHS